MAKKLTHKEKGFVKSIVKGKTGTQAILDNYDTTNEKSAGVMAVEILNKEKIQDAIKSIADQIPDELLVEKHLALLRKQDILSGVDTQAVKAGLEMAYKLKGSYAPEKSESKVVIETLSQEEKDNLLALLK
jgi:phage terminase small subunit